MQKIKIFIACPPTTVTGGVELLHQLAAQLNKYVDLDAQILYLGSKPSPAVTAAYSIYNNNYVVDIVPPQDSIIIFPEIWAHKTEFPHYQKCRHRIIYWESVDNYFLHNGGKDLPTNVIHFAQSHYAYNFLVSKMKVNDPVFPISDYLNEEFLMRPQQEQKNRGNVILYNPKKGYDFTKKVMRAYYAAYGRDTEFIPLTGLTREEVKREMARAPLYIDFGGHPGKDRLPRQAAMCGCCVMTSLSGSAQFVDDIRIPAKYKYETDEGQIDQIVKKMNYIVNNYKDSFKDFEEYRNIIREEKEVFGSQVYKFVKFLTRQRLK